MGLSSKYKSTISIFLAIAFLLSSIDISLAQEAISQSRDALAPSSVFKTLARIEKEGENQYSVVTDPAELERCEEDFKELVTALSAEASFVKGIGLAVCLDLSKNGKREHLKKIIRKTPGAEKCIKIDEIKENDALFTFTAPGGKEFHLRCFLPVPNEKYPKAKMIQIGKGRFVAVEIISSEEKVLHARKAVVCYPLTHLLNGIPEFIDDIKRITGIKRISFRIKGEEYDLTKNKDIFTAGYIRDEGELVIEGDVDDEILEKVFESVSRVLSDTSFDPHFFIDEHSARAMHVFTVFRGKTVRELLEAKKNASDLGIAIIFNTEDMPIDQEQLKSLFNNTAIIKNTMKRVFDMEIAKSDIDRITISSHSALGKMRDVYLVDVQFKSAGRPSLKFIMKVTKDDSFDYNTVTHEVMTKFQNEKAGVPFGGIYGLSDGRLVITGRFYEGVPFNEVKDSYEAQVAVTREAVDFWVKTGGFLTRELHRNQFIVKREGERSCVAHLIDKGHAKLRIGHFTPIELEEIDGELIPVSPEGLDLSDLKNWLTPMNEYDLLCNLVSELDAQEFLERIAEGAKFKLDRKAVVQGVVEALGEEKTLDFFAKFAKYAKNPDLKRDILLAIEETKPELARANLDLSIGPAPEGVIPPETHAGPPAKKWTGLPSRAELMKDLASKRKDKDPSTEIKNKRGMVGRGKMAEIAEEHGVNPNDVVSAVYPDGTPLDPVFHKRSSQGETVTFNEGEYVVRQGEPSEDVYLIKEGTVEVSVLDAGTGKTMRIAMVGMGEYIGEIGPYLHIPRTADVKVVGGSATLIKYTNEEFRSIVHDDSALDELVTRRMFETTKRLDTLYDGDQGRREESFYPEMDKDPLPDALRAIIPLKNRLKGNNVLVVGNAIPGLSTYLASIGMDVTFMDHEPGMVILEEGRYELMKSAKRDIGNLLRISGDIENFGQGEFSAARIEENSFDLILMLDLIGPLAHFTGDANKFIDAAYRLAKDGAVVYLSNEPLPDSYGRDVKFDQHMAARLGEAHARRMAGDEAQPIVTQYSYLDLRRPGHYENIPHIITKSEPNISFIEEATQMTREIPLRKSERKATLRINNDIVRSLSKRDLKKIIEIVTMNHDVLEDIRSLQIELDDPITVIKKKRLEFPIRFLQLKGVVFDADKKIRLHEGRGRLDYEYIPDRNGLIHEYKEEFAGDPQGGLELEGAVNEFVKTADMLYDRALRGSIVPKYPVGWGRFETKYPFYDKTGANKELGFVILGGSLENMIRQSKGYDTYRGRALRILHQNGYIHYNMHSENVGFFSYDRRCFIHDLDGALNWRDGMTREEMLVYQFNDFRRALVHQIRDQDGIGGCEMDRPFSNYNFIKGYFGEDAELFNDMVFSDIDDILNRACVAPIQEIDHPLINLLKRNMELAGLADWNQTIYRNEKLLGKMKNPPAVRCVVLDWDGTVIDSTEAYREAWGIIYARITKGRPNDYVTKNRRELEEGRNFADTVVGMSIYQTIREVRESARSKGIRNLRSVDEYAEEISNLVEEFILKKIEKDGPESVIIKETIDTIKELKKRGVTIIQTSGSSYKLLKRLVDRLGLRKLYDEVYGAYPAGTGKPRNKEELIRYIKKREPLKDNQIILIDDGDKGVAEARAAGALAARISERPDDNAHFTILSKGVHRDIIPHLGISPTTIKIARKPLPDKALTPKRLVGIFNGTDDVTERKNIAAVLKEKGILNTRIILDGIMPDGFRLVLCDVHGTNEKCLLFTNDSLDKVGTAMRENSKKSKSLYETGFVGGAVRNLITLRDLDVIDVNTNENGISLERVQDKQFISSLSKVFSNTVDCIRPETINSAGGFTMSHIVWVPALSKNGKITGGRLIPLKPENIHDLSENLIRMNSLLEKRTNLTDSLVERIVRFYFENNDCRIDADSIEQLMAVCDEYTEILAPIKNLVKRDSEGDLTTRNEYEYKRYLEYLMQILKRATWNPELHGLIMLILARNKSYESVDIMLDILEDHFKDGEDTPLTQRNVASLIAAIGRLIHGDRLERLIKILKSRDIASQDISLLLLGIIISKGEKEVGDRIKFLPAKMRISRLAAMKGYTESFYERLYLQYLLGRVRLYVKPAQHDENIDINTAARRSIEEKLYAVNNRKKEAAIIAGEISEEREYRPFVDFNDLRERIPSLTTEMAAALMPDLSDEFLFGDPEDEIVIAACDAGDVLQTEDIYQEFLDAEIAHPGETVTFSESGSQDSEIPDMAYKIERLRAFESSYVQWREEQYRRGLMPPLPDFTYGRRTSNGIWRRSTDDAYKLLARAGLKKGMKVLDVGNGNGSFGVGIADIFDATVHGMEIDSALAEEADRYAAWATTTRNLRVSFTNGDFRHMEEVFSEYSVIYYGVLGSDNHEELEDIVLRNLRPGQRFVVFRDSAKQPFNRLKAELNREIIYDDDGRRILGSVYTKNGFDLSVRPAPEGAIPPEVHAGPPARRWTGLPSIAELMKRLVKRTKKEEGATLPAEVLTLSYDEFKKLVDEELEDYQITEEVRGFIDSLTMKDAIIRVSATQKIKDISSRAVLSELKNILAGIVEWTESLKGYEVDALCEAVISTYREALKDIDERERAPLPHEAAIERLEALRAEGKTYIMVVNDMVPGSKPGRMTIEKALGLARTEQLFLEEPDLFHLLGGGIMREAKGTKGESCNWFNIPYFEKGLRVTKGVFPPGDTSTYSMLFEMDRKNFEGKRVLEIGCGSGVLSLRAAQLGAREVVALDIDDKALRDTEFNSNNLGFSDIIKVMKRDIINDDLADLGKFDVILFNAPPYGLGIELLEEIRKKLGSSNAIEDNRAMLSFVERVCPVCLEGHGKALLFIRYDQDILNFIYKKHGLRYETLMAHIFPDIGNYLVLGLMGIDNEDETSGFRSAQNSNIMDVVDKVEKEAALERGDLPVEMPPEISPVFRRFLLSRLPDEQLDAIFQFNDSTGHHDWNEHIQQMIAGEDPVLYIDIITIDERIAAYRIADFKGGRIASILLMIDDVDDRFFGPPFTTVPASKPSIPKDNDPGVPPIGGVLPDLNGFVNEESKQGEMLADDVKLFCQAAKDRGEGVVIGLESNGWIPALQKGMNIMQGLVNEITSPARLEKMLKELGLDNVRVVGGTGKELASNVKTAMGECGAKPENVIVLASLPTLEKEFDELWNKALLAAIDTRNLTAETADSIYYIRLCEMIRVSLRMAEIRRTLILQGRESELANMLRSVQDEHPAIDIVASARTDEEKAMIAKGIILLVPKAEPRDPDSVRKAIQGQIRLLEAA